jgi:hypothetical protein
VQQLAVVPVVQVAAQVTGEAQRREPRGYPVSDRPTESRVRARSPSRIRVWAGLTRQAAPHEKARAAIRPMPFVARQRGPHGAVGCLDTGRAPTPGAS